jgi:hypothetical protein
MSGSDELSGVRIEAERDGTVTSLHPGWMHPSRDSFLDPSPSTGLTLYRLIGLDRAGGVETLATADFTGGDPVLLLGFPDRNPFQGSIRFRAAFPGGPARVTVSDARGRRVRLLLDGEATPGTRELSWDGRDDWGQTVPAGLYFVQAEAGGSRAGFKVIRMP